MQSRNLKKFLFKKHHFKDFYYPILSGLCGFKIGINDADINKFRLKIHSSDMFLQKLITKFFNPICVLIRDKTIESSVKFNTLENPMNIEPPVYRYITNDFLHIKWKEIYLDIITVFRNYTLQIASIINEFENLFFDVNLNLIEKSKIELQRKVLITDEIVEFSPYIKKVKKEQLYKIPIFKAPVFKLSFTKNEIYDFREALAKQNKTVVTNVELISIYDRMNIDVYESIKPDSDNKGLNCFLKKSTTNNNQIYYLLIGKRRDNKSSIKALVPVDEN